MKIDKYLCTLFIFAFFVPISRSLKAMNLRGLFMAMTLIKFKDSSLRLCAAGMPSTLVYRAATNTVEEIKIRAVPLGSMTKFAYR